jgi:hypothetical protein
MQLEQQLQLAFCQEVIIIMLVAGVAVSEEVELAVLEVLAEVGMVEEIIHQVAVQQILVAAVAEQ